MNPPPEEVDNRERTRSVDQKFAEKVGVVGRETLGADF